MPHFEGANNFTINNTSPNHYCTLTCCRFAWTWKIQPRVSLSDPYNIAQYSPLNIKIKFAHTYVASSYERNALKNDFIIKMHWKMIISQKCIGKYDLQQECIGNDFAIRMHWKWFFFYMNALEIIYYMNALDIILLKECIGNYFSIKMRWKLIYNRNRLKNDFTIWMHWI